jgi:hypothetical protein
MADAKTTLDELKRNSSPPALRGENDFAPISFFTPAGFKLANQISQVFLHSTLLPRAFEGNVGNVLIALNLSSRMGVDPLMLMQNMYVVHGVPSFSAKFLVATFNANPKYSSIRYEWSGEKQTENYGCRAVSIEKSTGEVLRGAVVTMRMARSEGWIDKNGSKWRTMPDQMLMYRAASFFVKTFAPEISLGFPTVEEVLDNPQDPENFYATTEELMLEVTGKAASPVIEVKSEAIATDADLPTDNPAPATPPAKGNGTAPTPQKAATGGNELEFAAPPAKK